MVGEAMRAGRPAARADGAASSVLAPVVYGPARPATVLGVGRHAAYLSLAPAGSADPAVLALVTPDAVRVPNAVVISAAQAGHTIGSLRAGAAATVGGGRIETGAVRVVVTGTWGAGRPRLADPRTVVERAGELSSLVAASTGSLLPYLREPVDRLRAGLAVHEPDEAAAAARALLGLGPGLTPSGDDILAGTLVTLRALEPLAPPLQQVFDAVAATVSAHAPARTPLVSAELLKHAVAGRCIPQLAALLAALDHRPGRLEQALRGLLAVGHHSGGDLARGVALTLSAVRRDEVAYPISPRLEETWSTCC